MISRYETYRVLHDGPLTGPPHFSPSASGAEALEHFSNLVLLVLQSMVKHLTLDLRRERNANQGIEAKKFEVASSYQPTSVQLKIQYSSNHSL